jgi:GNAT superfamily N-acetyltransferase
MTDEAPQDVAFRPLAAAERTTVVALIRAYYAGEGYAFSPSDIERGLDEIATGDGLGHLWLIERRGEAVGYLCVAAGFSLEAGGRDFFLDGIYVVPEARGQGVGTVGLDFAEAQSRALGGRRLSLVTERANPRAGAFYEARGYTAHDRDMLSKDL